MRNTKIHFYNKNLWLYTEESKVIIHNENWSHMVFFWYVLLCVNFKFFKCRYSNIWYKNVCAFLLLRISAEWFYLFFSCVYYFKFIRKRKIYSQKKNNLLPRHACRHIQLQIWQKQIILNEILFYTNFFWLILPNYISVLYLKLLLLLILFQFNIYI